MEPISITYNEYLVTTDKSLLHLDDVYQWLSTKAYWCKHVPYEIVKRSFDNSYCIGVLKDGKQIGYGRLITDYATFAYLADVYVEEEHRGKGLSKKMMDVLMNLDWVKGLRAIRLATKDAHGLYEQYGFERVTNPERLMGIVRPDIYGDDENQATQ